MIHAQELIDKLKDVKLSIAEEEAYEAMETLTDKAIKDQFWKNRQVTIDDQHIRTLAKPFGVWRENVLINAWRADYELAGWKVEYNNSNQSDYWMITAKQ